MSPADAPDRGSAQRWRRTWTTIVAAAKVGASIFWGLPPVQIGQALDRRDGDQGHASPGAKPGEDGRHTERVEE